MKRFLLACGLCSAMLATAVFVFMPAGLAKALSSGSAPQKENVLQALLDLPAPPPPNPLESVRAHDASFYDPKNPPPDNAPIQDLLDYWRHFSENYRGIFYYVPHPSDRALQRMFSEGGTSAVSEILNILPDDKQTGETVKRYYDDPSTPKELRERLKSWLMYNSSYFTDEIERSASLVKDFDRYVSAPHQNALLALTRHDWEQARPIVDRLYADNSQPVSRALATWALYRHAIESGDLGDTDRYRSELMRIVENRNLPDGARDMANDAIVREPDFPGRDEWCWTLFEDETLVKMPYFTGLTTLIMYAPPDKYVAKMTEFLASNNKLVRTAAARNLITAMEREKSPEVIRALLPWVADPKWIDRSPDDSSRISLTIGLSTVKMPESVPVLISALDERATRQVEDYGSYGNANSNAYFRTSNAMNTAARRVQMQADWMANSANAIANSNSNVAPKMKEETYFPLREYAVRALGFQADGRAVPALRRLLNSTPTGYQRSELIAAIMSCGGFSVPEQVDALEKFARASREALATPESIISTANIYANTYYNNGYYEHLGRIAQGEDLEEALGMMVAASREPSDELVRATIERIEKLQTKDPVTAQAIRKIITSWKGLAVSAMLLQDLKTGKAESGAIVRLLAERKLISEKLNAQIEDARTGSPIAAGISTCLVDDHNAYKTALESKSGETQIAVLACARLIRAELPLKKVEEYLRSSNAVLKNAAELYLESEDSTEARSIIYAHHPGEAKILGATIMFPGRSERSGISADLGPLFSSVNSTAFWAPYMIYGANRDDFAKTEERLQKEVKEEADLIGVYAYQDNFVRVYKDRVMFSWEDDPSRYHERNLSAEEFGRLKEHFNAHRVSELKPFLACTSGCGASRELLMLGKNGGSRVFLRSESLPDFFSGLEKIFADFRAEPASIKYSLSKEVPGLELLFASDELDAQTVWKQGSDLRIVVSNKAVREKVEEEISQMEEQEGADDSEEEPAPDIAVPERPTESLSESERMRVRREYEGYAWHHIENGRLADAVTQPPAVEFIPVRDQFDVQAENEAWKARAGGVEIRANVTGLYKVVGSRMTKLRAGDYSDPVISANGRWVIVSKSSDDEGSSLVRFNLSTNREYPVTFQGENNLSARCFIPALGKVLLVAGYYGEDYYDRDDDENEPSFSSRRFYTIDPETGVVNPLNGEARPLFAQSFRPLQASTKPNQFWAAIPNRGRGETLVGLFDSRLLRFIPLLKLPKINFGSMEMWVDEAENKVYFVYSGHLLRVPLKTSQSK